MNLPHTTEEQIRRLAENPEVNRNWLNIQADLAGVDRDYLYGIDDGEEPIISNQNEDEI